MTTPEKKNTEQSFAKRVLGHITDEKLVPRPQWEFVLQNYVFWGVGIVAIIFGAFAFSAMIFEIENVEWQFALVTHSDMFRFLFDAAPLLWIGALALFILIGYLNVRRTNHGYRYPLSVIALGAVLTSLVLGTALYAHGIGGEVDDVIGSAIPFHQPILKSQRSWWLNPTQGLLGGSVVSVDPVHGSFVLRDFNNTLWSVDGSDLRKPDLTVVARGGVVRVVGVPTTATSTVFHACFVLSWEAHGLFSIAPLPIPFMFLASTSERSSALERSEICRDIRSYQQLRDIGTPGF